MHRTTLGKEVYIRFQAYKEKLADTLLKNDSLVSFTFDAGTSRASVPYLAVVAHWTDANYEMHEQPIGFRKINGNHSGENISSMLIEILKDFNIYDALKVRVFTNAAQIYTDDKINSLAGAFRIMLRITTPLCNALHRTLIRLVSPGERTSDERGVVSIRYIVLLALL